MDNMNVDLIGKCRTRRKSTLHRDAMKPVFRTASPQCIACVIVLKGGSIDIIVAP